MNDSQSHMQRIHCNGYMDMEDINIRWTWTIVSMKIAMNDGKEDEKKNYHCIRYDLQRNTLYPVLMLVDVDVDKGKVEKKDSQQLATSYNHTQRQWIRSDWRKKIISVENWLHKMKVTVEIANANGNANEQTRRPINIM